MKFSIPFGLYNQQPKTIPRGVGRLFQKLFSILVFCSANYGGISLKKHQMPFTTLSIQFPALLSPSTFTLQFLYLYSPTTFSLLSLYYPLRFLKCTFYFTTLGSLHFHSLFSHSLFLYFHSLISISIFSLTLSLYSFSIFSTIFSLHFLYIFTHYFLLFSPFYSLRSISLLSLYFYLLSPTSALLVFLLHSLTINYGKE